MLVGHRHVADDAVESFVHLVAGAGIDILRLLDPLNDVANLRVAVAAGKAARLRVEGVVICTGSPTPMLAGVAAALAALGWTRSACTTHSAFSALPVPPSW